MNGEERKVDIQHNRGLGTIIGTVTDYLTGILLSKILIEVFNLEEELIASTVTNFSGKYKLTGLPIGKIIMKARSKSFILQSKVVTLKANGN
ncbi:carboxypeptidase-like regulatory domain-containing protein [Priestia megaterium]|uniref:carboxypeptidase-like regulatory domain-containing protein n=1 Tax=Priestia megaterium TaxID=1404 RepID=UPI0025B18EDA|nr:carboxypeptidase-like regulatory domain-containing protein [Priestia megaterium]MDN3233274.1 carboxypeptidase-like regulatory domain-containing protein [Priestia megaterium]